MFLKLQESILLDPMFEIPGSNIVEVNITENVVLNKDEPEFIRKADYDKNDDKNDQQEVDSNTATRAKYNVFN